MEIMRKLPEIAWRVDANTVITANDFTVVYQISEDWFNQTNVQFDLYPVNETDTPESLAATAYDDPTLYWVILVANRIVDRRTEWYMNQNQLLNYIFDKYYIKLYRPDGDGWVYDEENSARTTYEHLRFEGNETNNWTAQYYYTEDGGILEAHPHHFETEDGDWVPRGTKGAIPISIYEYEAAVNESRRYIRMPTQELVDQMKRAL